MASTLKIRRHQLASWWRKRQGIEPLVADKVTATLPVGWVYLLQIAGMFFVILVASGILLSLHYEPSARGIYQHGKPLALAHALETVVVQSDTLCTQNEILLLPIVGKTVEFPSDQLTRIHVLTGQNNEPLRASAATVSIEQKVMQEVPFGGTIRGIHLLSVHCFIGCLMLSVLMLFWKRGFRAPLEFVWLMTLGIVTTSFVSAFSGHILVWNVGSYISAQIALRAIEYLPFGETLVYIVRGGSSIHPEILPRMFALHVLVLPLILVALLRGVIVLARRFGAEIVFKYSFFLQCSGVIVFLGSLAPLFPIYGKYYERFPADLTTIIIADSRIRPDWYFLAGYQLLRSMPVDLAVTILAMWGIFWIAVPFVGNTRRKRIIIWLMGIGLMLITVIFGVVGLLW